MNLLQNITAGCLEISRCIKEAPSSNLTPKTARHGCGFTVFLQANSRVVS